MTKTQFPQFALIMALASITALACNVSQPAATFPTVMARLATETPVSVTAAPPITPTSSPVPIPAGWVAFASEAPQLSFYHPPDWTPVASDESRIEVRPADGFAWLEISLIDATHPGPGGLAFASNSDLAMYTQTLLAGLREDGVFDDPVRLSNGWAITGRNDRFGEDVIVGVVGLNDRVVMLIGHPGGEGEDWETLQELYLQVIQFIGS